MKCIMTVDDAAVSARWSAVQECVIRDEEEGDGQDVRQLNGSGIHMIVTDLNMPNLDGIGLIKEVRSKAEYKFIPIIMLTTESQDSKKQEGKTAGATGWIVKPFKPDQLLAVVKKVLG